MQFSSFLNRIFFKEKTKIDLSDIEKDAELITGIDLRIDPTVQEICKVYNTSSGSTRSALYILLLINILSLMAVINTHKGNWTLYRIDNQQKYIEKEEKALIDLNHNHENFTYKTKNAEKIDEQKHQYTLDSMKIADKIRKGADERNNLIRNEIENSQTVRVPILGNSFDIDNLSIVSGMSFFILLMVVRFTLIREKNNLRIALNSISERYSGNLDNGLNDDLDIIVKQLKRNDIIKNKEALISAVNYKRRRYHYNFLSMNEIFNIPMLDVSKNMLPKTKIGRFVIGYLYTFTFLVYFIVVINDVLTINKAYKISHWQTITVCIISYVFLNFIARFCEECNKQKKTINYHFDDFRDNKYIYDRIRNLESENPDVIGTGRELKPLGKFLKILFFNPFYFIYFIARRIIWGIGGVLFSSAKIN